MMFQHQMLKNKLVSNWPLRRKVGGLFGIGVTLATLQQTRKLHKWSSHWNATARCGAKTSAVLFKNKRKHTQWINATTGIQIQQEPPHYPWPEGKGNETGRLMASGWQIYRVHGLLSIEMGQQHFCLPDRLTDQTTSPPHPPNKRRKRWIWT